MNLLSLGLSKRSINVRYNRAAASFGPGGEMPVRPDPVTQAALTRAADQLFQSYREELTFEGELLGNGLHRLIITGYLVGRVEAGTEHLPLCFSALAEDQDYEAREFRLATGHCTAAGAEQGVFSRRPSRAVSEMLGEFLLAAAQTLGDRACAPSSESRRVTEACARAINLGREVALMEDVYLNPKSRGLVLEIRQRVQKEQALRLRLAHEGLASADDIANQTMRRVVEVISG